MNRKANIIFVLAIGLLTQHTTACGAQDAKPSLKQTLDWLAEKLDTLAGHGTNDGAFSYHVVRVGARSLVYTETLVAPITHKSRTTKVTLTLELLKSVRVEDGDDPLQPEKVKVYYVILTPSEPEGTISAECDGEREVNRSRGKATIIRFADEKIAARVGKAFTYAIQAATERPDLF